MLQCWPGSHCDCRTLSSSCNVWISRGRPSTNRTAPPVQFSHSSSGALKVSDCSSCTQDGKRNRKSVNGPVSPPWWKYRIKILRKVLGRKLVGEPLESPSQCLIHACQGHNVTVMQFVLGQKPSRTYPAVQAWFVFSPLLSGHHALKRPFYAPRQVGGQCPY